MKLGSILATIWRDISAILAFSRLRSFIAFTNFTSNVVKSTVVVEFAVFFYLRQPAAGKLKSSVTNWARFGALGNFYCVCCKFLVTKEPSKWLFIYQL